MICKIKKFKALTGIYRYGFKLLVDKEYYDNGRLEILGCKNCAGLVHLPAYFCLLTNSFICNMCERSKFGQDTCDRQNRIEEHDHIRITEIKIIDE